MNGQFTVTFAPLTPEQELQFITFFQQAREEMAELELALRCAGCAVEWFQDEMVIYPP